MNTMEYADILVRMNRAKMENFVFALLIGLLIGFIFGYIIRGWEFKRLRDKVIMQAKQISLYRAAGLAGKEK